MVLLLACCIQASPGLSQVVVQANGMNILYLGTPNPLTIVATNYNRYDIVLKTDNGSIKEDMAKGPGHYVALPAKPGMATIEVRARTKNGHKLISKQQYRVKHIPARLELCGHTGGYLTPGMLSRCNGPTLTLDGAKLTGPLPMRSYTLRVMRDSMLVVEKVFDNAEGLVFDEQTKRALGRLPQGATLYIEQAKYTDIDGKPVEIWGLQFTIITDEEWKRLYE